ncbi:MAG: 4Fe-4S binding protein [Oscillospiraceae bacterium]|jgi:NAD-dependent dihydropyrimidine dehydrogenase PreA subunit|nr:4Fe-4S binding protein [Oscillospiraceae bacterium]
MIRKIITINEEKCNGCGLCADACHEGAIGIIDGKARLLREDYCDGLGDCLPACPMHAISFEEREAPAYDEAAVLAAKEAKEASLPCGCPGSVCQSISHSAPAGDAYVPSKLTNFPVQIKLTPPNASYFDGADLLIAADCTAYSYGNFHCDFMQDKVTLIGCPKLDAVDYAEKLTQIFKYNNIRSITVTKMSVPCCGGLSYAVKTALENSGKDIPLHIVTIRPDGQIIR